MANDQHNGTNEPLDRRRFLGKAAVAASASLAACGGASDGGGPAVQTNPRVQWRLASSFPPNLDALYGAAERLAERVSALTEGRFTIRAHPAGEIVGAFEVLDAAQQGTVQVGHSASYYFTGKNPVLAFDTGVPFGLTSRQQMAWLQTGGGHELMQEVFSDFGIISFLGGNTGAQMGGWFKREVNSAADLRGLKMRIPGLGGQVMDRLGVTVQNLAGGEIYPALERGVIDATEWVGPYDDEKLEFQRAARFYYYPGWWEPGPSMSFYVNRSAWDQLPSVYQEAFRAATVWAGTATQLIYDAQNPPALKRLVDGGVQLRRFSDDILIAAHTAARAIQEENAAANASYRKVYEAWKTFRDQSFSWFATTEQAFAEFAFTRIG